MKIVILLALCGLAAAFNVDSKPVQLNNEPILSGARSDVDGPQRNIMDTLLPIVFDLLRTMMKEGYPELGIPILDPLEIDELKVDLPNDLVNLNLDLKKVKATGLSEFEILFASFNIPDLTFELDMVLPDIEITAEYYNLLGDLFSAIPLYGKGTAAFKIEKLRFSAKIYLGQSKDELSIIIDRLDNVRYEIPNFKSDLTGVIGGGDIDDVVNAVINEVIIDYLRRFERYISSVLTTVVPNVLNPILETFESWEIINNFDP